MLEPIMLGISKQKKSVRPWVAMVITMVAMFISVKTVVSMFFRVLAAIAVFAAVVASVTLIIGPFPSQNVCSKFLIGTLF